MTDTSTHIDAIEGDAPAPVSALPNVPVGLEHTPAELKRPAENPPTSNSTVAAGEVDKDGVAWDANLHQSDRSKTKGGTWKKKKGRKSGAQNVSQPRQSAPQNTTSSIGRASTPQNVNEVPAANSSIIPNHVAAGQMVQLLQAAACSIGGMDMAFRKGQGLDEQADLEMSFTQYFDAKGGNVPLPPSLVLAAGLMKWLAPRFRDSPEVKKRVSSRWSKVSLFVKSRFKRAKSGVSAKRAKAADNKEPETKGTTTVTKPEGLGAVNPDFEGLN